VTDLVTRVRRRMVTDDADLIDLVRTENDGIVDDSVLATLRRDVEAELVGAGPLEPLLATPGVTDVLVTAPDAVWVDRGSGLERAAVRFADDAAVRRLANRLVAAAGRRLDDAMPYADVTLPDGSRLHVVLPPLVERPALSLRVLARAKRDLDELGRAGTFSFEIGAVLRAIVAARLAVVVSGGTGVGKTTLLGALLALVPCDERLLIIEDCRELMIEHPHVVRLVTRTANVEGGGAVGMRELVRLSLRMRPDRIVVGEFRGAEMVELLVALNTGHEGGAATVHANSAADVPARLVALGSLGGVGSATVASLASSAIDVVVQLCRRGGVRSVREIGLLESAGDGLQVRSVWSAAAGFGPARIDLGALIADRGAPVPVALRP
jgi:pilus assembly protein CpaF